jgi:hypothetical protein
MDKWTLLRPGLHQLSGKQENKPTKLSLLQYKIPIIKSTKSPATPGDQLKLHHFLSGQGHFALTRR